MEQMFRVWYEEKNRMVHFGLQELLRCYNDEWDFNAVLGTDLFKIHGDVDDDDVMPYVGLEDKNGKMIYAGDIVRTTNRPDDDDPDSEEHEEHYEGVVTYKDAGYVIVQKDSTYAPSLTNIFIETIEVVGNMYENLVTI